jgi:hypothetical protein
MSEVSQNEARFCTLGWAILELKLAYYHPNTLHPDWIAFVSHPDTVYDKIEDEYRTLAKALNVSPSAADMVDVDFLRPSVRLVQSLLSNPKGPHTSTVERVLGGKRAT